MLSISERGIDPRLGEKFVSLSGKDTVVWVGMPPRGRHRGVIVVVIQGEGVGGDGKEERDNLLISEVVSLS